MAPLVRREFRHEKYRNLYEYGEKRYLSFEFIDNVISAFRRINPFTAHLEYEIISKYGRSVDLWVHSLKGLIQCSKKFGNDINYISLSIEKEFDFDIKNILKYTPNINSLYIPMSPTKFNNINLLNNLNNLIKLSIDWSNVEKLNFDGNETLKSLKVRYSDLKNGIPHIPNLQVLWVDNFNQSDVSEIARCPNLRKLSLIKSRKLESLRGVAELQHLEYVLLYGLGKLTSLKDLNELEKLRYLLLERCRNLSDLSGISGSPMLEYLSFHECNNLGDLHPLKSCQRLIDLHLRVETNLDASYEEVVSALPNLRYTNTDLTKSRKI